MNITLRQLRAFLAVARTGSFTLAAESLFLTQSAVSGLIKELEQTLGLRLIDRSTKRLRLSEVGRDVFPVVDKLLRDLDVLLSDVADRKALRTGVVRVAAPQLLASTRLPEIIAAYRLCRPDIKVKLMDVSVESITGRVVSGEVDFGIGPERDMTSDVLAELLFEGRFMVAFPPDHPLAHLEAVRWSDFAAYPYISLQGQFTERLAIDLKSATNRMNFLPDNEVAFMSTALAMVGAGMGVAACITYAAGLADLYGLKLQILREPEVRRSFYVLTQRNRSLTPAAMDFKCFVQDYVSAHRDGFE